MDPEAALRAANRRKRPQGNNDKNTTAPTSRRELRPKKPKEEELYPFCVLLPPIDGEWPEPPVEKNDYDSRDKSTHKDTKTPQIRERDEDGDILEADDTEDGETDTEPTVLASSNPTASTEESRNSINRLSSTMEQSPTPSEDDEELLNRWAVYPATRSIKPLRNTIYQSNPSYIKDRVKIKQEDDFETYEPQVDTIYDPEELYGRLDRMRANGRDGREGYTIEEVLGYKEDDRERLERLFWISAAVFMILIAVLLLGLGMGWKLFGLWERIGVKASKTKNVPTPVLPKLPPRPKMVPTTFKGAAGAVWDVFAVAGVVQKIFMTAGVGYFTGKVVVKKSVWQRVFGGKGRSIAALGEKKRRGWF
ncbi:hypothetical protein TWF481_002335 [Arthrobotrys musiformis]|uniref:Uncharacterized protein n=1 Tax=Arthrobotrys musiformis TaxID=47236 RepID=A0AAV9VVQ6_9PEZI